MTEPRSDWTLTALKGHVEVLLGDLRTYVDALRAADKEAVKTATAALEKRLEALNELRKGVATTDALEALSNAVRRVERLVYIGTGLALAASVAVPLLLSK